jgi:hypothetical protein
MVIIVIYHNIYIYYHIIIITDHHHRNPWLSLTLAESTPQNTRRTCWEDLAYRVKRWPICWTKLVTNYEVHLISKCLSMERNKPGGKCWCLFSIIICREVGYEIVQNHPKSICYILSSLNSYQSVAVSKNRTMARRPHPHELPEFLEFRAWPETQEVPQPGCGWGVDGEMMVKFMEIPWEILWLSIILIISYNNMLTSIIIHDQQWSSIIV